MKRLRLALRRAMTASPLAASSSQSAARGAPGASDSCSPAAMEWMGASELLISWLSTRMRRFHASRSSSRSASLSRFMSSYARLARLPPPSLGTVSVSEWVRRVASLEKRLEVPVRAGPELTLRADGDQLEQLLINLVRNAVDAALETGGRVWVSWSVVSAGALEVWVEDEGPGLPETANLFVPFFTTKPNGSGIGLALSRQIAEAHGGSVRLENRVGERGCRARLRLPFETRTSRTG